MNAHDVVVIGVLVDRCPRLLPVLQDHLDDYDRLLSHVFLGDVARWAVERSSADPLDRDLACALESLNASFDSGRTDDRELIAASFLENLPKNGQPGGDIRRLLGPALQQHLAQYG